MAQQCFMFLDWGDGWKSVNDHAEDVAALAASASSGAPMTSPNSPNRR